MKNLIAILFAPILVALSPTPATADWRAPSGDSGVTARMKPLRASWRAGQVVVTVESQDRRDLWLVMQDLMRVRPRDAGSPVLVEPPGIWEINSIAHANGWFQDHHFDPFYDHGESERLYYADPRNH